MNDAAKKNAAQGGYAGDVSPRDAWNALGAGPSARLIDCRSQAEWSFVGTPFLAERAPQLALVEWQKFPAMTANAAFIDEVRKTGAKPGDPLYLLCRSGARSKAAAIALTAAGFGPCYNVAGGFEGARDPAGHRGGIEGWKASGLPWRQD